MRRTEELQDEENTISGAVIVKRETGKNQHRRDRGRPSEMIGQACR